MRAITLASDDFEAIYGVFIANDIVKHLRPIFFHPSGIIAPFRVIEAVLRTMAVHRGRHCRHLRLGQPSRHAMAKHKQRALTVDLNKRRYQKFVVNTIHPPFHWDFLAQATEPHVTSILDRNANSSQIMSRYGSNLTPAVPSPGSKIGAKGRSSRGRREPSGVFTLFQPAQVQQFREAFSLIDQDGDGIVSEEDLKRIFASLGERLCGVLGPSAADVCMSLSNRLDTLQASHPQKTNCVNYFHHGQVAPWIILATGSISWNFSQ